MIKLYETDRLYVRPFEKTDMNEKYRSWFLDQEVTMHNSHGLFPYTKDQMNDFFSKLELSSDLVWVVISKEITEPGVLLTGAGKQLKVAPSFNQIEHIHIGNISLQNINWINRSAEFACVFGEKDYWGNGYCTESAKLLFDHGFNKLNLHRIWTGTAATNTGMARVASKLGMEREGIFKEAMFLNGKYVDVYEYGILENEWRNE